MHPESFQAFVTEQDTNGECTSRIQERTVGDLPDHSVLIRVHYSSLNYKDALSARGHKGVTKQYPHTPGIDAVGTVVSSCSDHVQAGNKVIVTSYDLGMNTHGGFGEYICVPAEWVVPLPSNMSMKEAMAFGTAGLTAGMSVQRLIETVQPADGPIIVSGATGGVGLLSIAILAHLGYSVTALSGNKQAYDVLRQHGAQTVLPREELMEEQSRPLLKEQFAGAIDTVGGNILVNIIKSTKALGTITCCGNVASAQLELTVFPFILRGLSLIGIDSQQYPMHKRTAVWNALANEWKPDGLLDLCTEIPLTDLDQAITSMMNNTHTGRTIINLGAN